MAPYQIKAIELTTSNNPSHYHIERVLCSWVDAFTGLRLEDWMMRQYVAEQIDAGRATAFTSVNGMTIPVGVERYANGKKYLRTVPDHTAVDNLLSLPKYYV